MSNEAVERARKLAADLGDLQKSYGALTLQRDKLKAEVDAALVALGLTSDIAALRTAKTAAENELAALLMQIARERSSIEALKVETGSTEKRLNEFNTELAAARKRLGL